MRAFAQSGYAVASRDVVVDDAQGFVGSMNMDQRLKLLNIEMVVIIDAPALAQAVKKIR